MAPGYCCLPIQQSVTSQAGHIKQRCEPFYSLVDIENDRIQHFGNIFYITVSEVEKFRCLFQN